MFHRTENSHAITRVISRARAAQVESLVFKIHHRITNLLISLSLSRLVKARLNGNLFQFWPMFGGKINFHRVCLSQPVQMMLFEGKMRRPFQSYSYALCQAGTFKVYMAIAPVWARDGVSRSTMRVLWVTAVSLKFDCKRFMAMTCALTLFLKVFFSFLNHMKVIGSLNGLPLNDAISYCH